MLGIATTNVPAIRGSSSVFKIASTWNIKIFKYTDLVSCMEEYQYKPIRLGAHFRINTKGLVHALRNPFVKVEDQTRKYRPDIVEMKSFPYLDFDNEGTSSPFDTYSSDDSNELQTEFYVKGKIVCREAWLLAHNLNKETFRRIWGKFKDGANENRFTKCTDCTKYKQEKEKTVDKARRAEIDHLLKLHLDLFDNCVRENKNRYMFALLALLVEEKIFEKIRVNFLLVGHTHEDIDAFFGVFSKHLDKLDVYTSTCKILIYFTLHCHLELLKALETCMKNPTPKPYMLKMVYDTKSWISDYGNQSTRRRTNSPTPTRRRIKSRKPNPVTPSLNKLDMEGLKRDIPTKYPENMPLKASEE
ncbi:unnamed protein product [Pocillopora meandrina]|uniref:DUF7869 domain-containing protein n=1 Tax=Pocillopora meandrina TaxID=46732 RepID=A0AAU9Y3K1_9CNID|nr:unnamed protein product [Pocillopora meandrina]